MPRGIRISRALLSVFVLSLIWITSAASEQRPQPLSRIEYFKKNASGTPFRCLPVSFIGSVQEHLCLNVGNSAVRGDLWVTIKNKGPAPVWVEVDSCSLHVDDLGGAKGSDRGTWSIKSASQSSMLLRPQLPEFAVQLWFWAPDDGCTWRVLEPNISTNDDHSNDGDVDVIAPKPSEACPSACGVTLDMCCAEACKGCR